MTHPASRSALQRTAEITIAALLGLLSIVQNAAFAQGDLPPRLQIGINLLPAVIAARTGIAELPADRALKLYFVYLENRRDAEALQRAIGRIGMIKKRPLETGVLSLDELLAMETEPLATLFVAEPLGERLGELVGYSQARRALLFSPFEGDVGKGVAAGLHITDRVRPLVDMQSLKLSKIQLKAFFLRVAVKHE